MAAVKDQSRVNDHYSRKARLEGYPARSVYKLEEIDRKYRLFRPGQRVLDLGCAPGSWTLYAAEKVGAKGRVIGLDLTAPILTFPPQVTIWQADILIGGGELMAAAAAKGAFDVLLSDMAPKTCGRREVDQARSLELSETAWLWAERLLKTGGQFLCKLFQSAEGEIFIQQLKKYFNKIELLKPKATRGRSVEVFILGQCFRPGNKADVG